MPSLHFIIDHLPAPGSIADLREAVGWGRQDEDYPRALAGYWATASGLDDAGALRAWCAILSDGVYHAVLLDVIVHPAHQGQGNGLALVQVALAYCRARGIRVAHVDFEPETRGFNESPKSRSPRHSRCHCLV